MNTLTDLSVLPNKLLPFVYSATQQNLLQRLLKGQAREVEYLPELLKYFDLQFRSEQFAVMAVRLCGENHSSESWAPPPETNVHELAVRFFKDSLGWDAWCLFQDDVFFAVLCRNGVTGVDPWSLGQQLVERLKKIHPLAVAVSEEKTGMGGINDGYYEVMEVLGVIDMQARRNEALSFSNLNAETYESMDTTFERDRRLINSVLEGNHKDTISALQQMDASGNLEGRNTLMLEKRRLLGVVNQMTAEITSGGDAGFLSELGAFQKIMDAPAAEQLSATFRSVVLGLCDYYSGIQTALGASRVLRIVDYIDRHYADPDLSIDTLSGIFKISPSYLSRIFKREKGIGVLPYLQNKRVAQARALLGTTDLKIREIALQVGFLNDQTFTRTFKTVTGTTPSEYRKNRL